MGDDGGEDGAVETVDVAGVEIEDEDEAEHIGATDSEDGDVTAVRQHPPSRDPWGKTFFGLLNNSQHL